MIKNTIQTCSLIMAESARQAATILDSESIQKISHFVLKQQNRDGGFKGRSVESDLYYTWFGIACLDALEIPLPADTISDFLNTFGDGANLDLIHLSSFVRCWSRMPEQIQQKDRNEILLNRIEQYSRKDGGYRMSLTDETGSIYASFLALLSLEDMNQSLRNSGETLHFMENFRTEDNAYAEGEMKSGTTPVTAAAVVLKKILRNEVNQSEVEWLLSRQSKHGGFLATPGTPVPDLLTTATTLFTLKTVSPDGWIPSKETLAFIESLWHESGGFCGHLFETTPDCEYTYYGLLGLGVIAEMERKNDIAAC